MIRLLTILSIVLILAFAVNAQDCPPDKVCLSPEAARAALQAGDRVTALEAEIKARGAAYSLLKDELEKMRIEFAKVSGENSALRQNAVQDRALIEILIKYARPKTNGIKIF